MPDFQGMDLRSSTEYLFRITFCIHLGNSMCDGAEVTERGKARGEALGTKQWQLRGTVGVKCGLVGRYTVSVSSAQKVIRSSQSIKDLPYLSLSTCILAGLPLTYLRRSQAG